MQTRGRSGSVEAVLLLALTLAYPLRAVAQPEPSASNASAQASPEPSPSPPPERWSVHAQSTNTQQYHGPFPAAYSGPQSLYSGADTAKTIDVTLFLGARLWKGGEAYIDPELDQGFGLGQPRPPGTPYLGTIGAAGFLSGEAYNVGSDSSYGRVQRAFVRQTYDLGGGDRKSIDPDSNQLGGSVDPNHLVLTAGKFAVTDVFDNNTYAHDPKNDFLNWTIIDMGSFDYAADAWGYTYGMTAELAQGRSTVRAGLFQLSAEPNAIAIEGTPLRQYSPVLEYERRTSFFGGRQGAVKALVYGDDGYMGSYADAVSFAERIGAVPATASVRGQKHLKAGGGINIAQEIAPNIGVFARASAMNGTYEAFEFTDVDRSLSAGISVDGHLYRRPNDAFGLAGAMNGASSPAATYFSAGGSGILVGDGELSYGDERVIETYYKIGFGGDFALTVDYQRLANPAYNTARGPVSVFGLRYHAQI